MSTNRKKIVRLTLLAVAAALIFLAGTTYGVYLATPNRAVQTDVAAVNALRSLGLALKDYSRDHERKLPATLAEVQPPIFDPFTRTRTAFKYVGGGRLWNDLDGNGILACTSNQAGDEHQFALFSGGYAMRLSKEELSEKLRKLPPSH